MYIELRILLHPDFDGFRERRYIREGTLEISSSPVLLAIEAHPSIGADTATSADISARPMIAS